MEYRRPEEIERHSFELIEKELPRELKPDEKPVIMRVIHTTADFEYASSLCFSEGVIPHAVRVLKNGAAIITDTNMALAGINKAALHKLHGNALCYMADPEVAREAKEREITRASVSMEKAMEYPGPLILAVGNAPTALLRLDELIREKGRRPELVIGVPVGFVNVAEAKKIIMQSGVPYIVAKGRKGGSNVAAAICNALLYETLKRNPV
ncbi:precorrin-8X methylmutase [Anaerolentibacter hominis]|uniref:precorrin-8X methylmutase n=1 Tax=Anaerolentibacter hominis TaxID=3079009 RepID=UPI0031B88E06